MRITQLAYANRQLQGAQRREWLRQYSPQHLEWCKKLTLDGLQQRASYASRSTIVLGAGACTEVPLAELVRASDEVVLADLDKGALIQAGNELNAQSQRRKVQTLLADLSGDVSAHLEHMLQQLDWQMVAARGAETFFDVAAAYLEQCPVPDPPTIGSLNQGEFGLVVSSLLLSQLFSYPLLDVLDLVQRVAPEFLLDQERHQCYQAAALKFRIRIIKAHLHLLRFLLDAGGAVVLLSDVRGFAFTVYGTDHDAQHRRMMPLVPRAFHGLLHDTFSVVEEAQWEWLTDLPTNERPGRGYIVNGFVLKVPD